MSRAIAWQRRGGGGHSHVFVWPMHGTAGTIGTGRHRPWLLYGRKGGVHGQFFVWHTEGAAAATPPPTGGRHPVPSWMRRWQLLDLRRP